MILKTYTQNDPTDLKEILETVCYSETQLASLKVIEYPEELVRLVSHSINKDESIVWYELLQLENQEKVTKVTNTEELVESVEVRQCYIYIPEPFRQEQRALIQSVLTEKDRLGFELGSGGTGNILAEIIYQIGRIFGEGSPEFKRLKSKLRHYYVKVHDESGSLLYEKEQTY